MLKKKVPDALATICHYCSIRHYCLFLKDMGWKHTAYHIINSDPGHTRSKQQLDKTLKITFASLSRKSDEKEKKKKKTRMAIAKLFAFHANAKKKIMQFDWVLLFLLTQNLSFWLRILDNNTKWCIKMVITSNKSTFVIKKKFHLSIQPNILWKIFGISFFF